MTHIPEGYAIRVARVDDIIFFGAIETEADRLYDDTGLMTDATNTYNIPVTVLRDAVEADLMHSAVDHTGEIAGFTLCSLREPDLYLDQVAVLPEHGRKGLGTTLIETVFEDARRRKMKAVSLSTFRDVPWNGPYYARLGFTEIPRIELTPWMLELEALQAEYLDITKRCFMRKLV